MKTSTTFAQSNSRIRLALITLLTLLGIYSCSVQAQGSIKRKYLGLEASFGTRAFNLNSDIKALNNARLGHIGGSIGFVYGNEIIKTRIRTLGYFCPDNNNPRPQDIYESSLTTNFYPFEFVRTHNALFHPYITTGFSRTTTKYYGNYLNDGNWAGKEEPFLGKVIQYNVVGGLGVEMRLETDRDFVHLFLEGMFEKTLSRNSRQAAFEKTSATGITSFNIGVSFGRKRF
jgi:hypothetical protein